MKTLPKNQKNTKPAKKEAVRKPKKNRFSDIALPDRAGDTERPGKKSVGWQDDPEILQRLSGVADMMNKNYASWRIAEELKVSIATAKRDIARVRELWAMDAKERLKYAKEEAISQYDMIKKQVWEDLLEAPISLRPSFYNAVLRAQERIDKVNGIADPTSIQGVPGMPVEVSVTDMEEIRAKRWEQINAKVKKVIADDGKTASKKS